MGLWATCGRLGRRAPKRRFTGRQTMDTQTRRGRWWRTGPTLTHGTAYVFAATIGRGAPTRDSRWLRSGQLCRLRS